MCKAGFAGYMLLLSCCWAVVALVAGTLPASLKARAEARDSFSREHTQGGQIQLLNGSVYTNEYELLVAIFQEMAADGITASLVGGSVLGAFRHMGVIPVHDAKSKSRNLRGDKDMDINTYDATAEDVFASLSRVIPPTRIYPSLFGFHVELYDKKKRGVVAGYPGYEYRDCCALGHERSSRSDQQQRRCTDWRRRMTKVQWSTSDNIIGCQLTTATYLDVWVQGRFDWDLNAQTEIKSSIKPIHVPESTNKFFRRQFASIIDPKSSYVCLGHLRWITADLHEYTNNTRELQSAWGRAAKVGEMPNGGGVPFGTCNVWFTEHLLLPNRKTRWGWLKTTFFDEKTPLEDVWPSPVLPSSLIFPLNRLPFGPKTVFPVYGQVYAALKMHYPYYDHPDDLGWNTTCGGWSHGERNCSDFYDTNPFVFVTRYHNGSELLSLKLGQKVLRTYLFEPSISVPLAYEHFHLQELW